MFSDEYITWNSFFYAETTTITMNGAKVKDKSISF